MLGWLLLPLVFFGVDETLDPARFALLPLPRRTLVTGLFAAALIGVPALAVLSRSSGLVLTAAVARWPVGAAVVAAVGVARRGAALRRRQPGGDQRLRHHAAVPPGPRPGRRAAGAWSPRCSARCRSSALAALRSADWDRLAGVGDR